MKRHFFFVTFSLVFMLGQLFAQTLNQFDKQGRRKGKWIVYADSSRSIKLTEGKYRKGQSVGKFYYYTPEGNLERREIIRLNRLFTQTYYPNGSVRSKGKARIDHLPDRIHYYYFGEWKYYDNQGNILKYCYYKKGKKIRTVYVKGNSEINDSLKTALLTLDENFKLRHAALLDSVAYSAFNIKKRELFQNEIYQRDTMSFYHLADILSKQGYPHKETVQEAVEIPFYILSHAPLSIRDTFLPVLKKAADSGDLSWKSLSFYIDKLQLAKGEKQIYGTQYYFKNKQIVYYPVQDPESLELRRKELGL